MTVYKQLFKSSLFIIVKTVNGKIDKQSALCVYTAKCYSLIKRNELPAPTEFMNLKKIR